ncbi:hypothetical protein HRbin19_00002 [bacterium HR19]|nr:hypothetical protein HRbin19_00002 [bacterium HR19]
MPKYIEEKFPIAFVNSISTPERIALKPVYMMHRIFGRRIGSVLRTILLSALKDADTDIEREFYSSHRNNPDTKDITILDPMAGGGTTLIEGSRLSAKVIGFEINPVPWFITKCELTIVNIEELENKFKHLEQNIGRKIKNMYETICPVCFSSAEIIYVFWIKVVDCVRCKRKIELFNDYIITYDKKGKNHFILCPICFNVFHIFREPHKEEKCPSCGHFFNPFQGSIKKNRIECPSCSVLFELVDALKSKNNPPEIKQFAIDGWCPKCRSRFIKPPDESDFALYEKIKQEFELNKDKLLFPRNPIPDGFNTNQMKKHNYKFWYQMFNERQLLSLSLLLSEIMKIEKEDIREIMLCAFSETLRSNNLFCYYDRRWAKQLTPLFARKDFAPVNFPLEQNIWGSKFGRGSFKQVFERILKAKKYNLSPFERKYIGKKIKRIYLDEKIGRSDWQIYCDDARNMDKYLKERVDLVVTDPPYFDSINYSEVYDFFYVWLRLALKNKYPWFEPETGRREGEAIENEIHGKKRENYKRILTEIFKKSAELLKDDGLFIFTFHDIEESAWMDMYEIVKQAGLSVVKIHFYHGENVSAGHYGGQKTVFDAIWVCKKDLARSQKYKNIQNHKNIDEIIGRVRSEVNILVDEILRSKFFKLNEEDLKVFVMGKTIEVGKDILTKEMFYKILTHLTVENMNLLNPKTQGDSSINLKRQLSLFVKFVKNK